MWFLVLLFWNPTLQIYDVSDGWYPIPYMTETICEMKRDYVKMYIPNYSAGMKHVVECIPAPDMWTAIATAKEAAND